MIRAVAVFRLLQVVAFALSLAQSASALDPERSVTQYGIQAWTTAQGLPSNAVNAVVQSRDGYLWLGTEDGLVRFDGLEFTIFDRSNTPALRVNSITGLAETRDGALWIATAGGGLVCYRDGSFTRFGSVEGVPDDRIWSLCPDGADGLWFGTPKEGLSRWEGGRIRAVAGTAGRFTGGINTLRLAPAGSYGMGTQGTASGLWVGSGTQLGLYKNGSFSALALPEPFSKALIVDILPDRRGRLWVGTDLGVVRLEREGHTPFTSRQGCLNDRVFFLAEDGGQNVWIGSYGGGLARVSPDDRLDVLTTANGLADDRPLCFSEDGEGSAWVGTRGGGLNRLTGGPATPWGTPEGLTSDRVYPILEDRDGALWMGTAGGGVNRIRDGSVTAFTTRDGLSSDTVYALYQDRSGTIWAGANDGALNRFDGHGFTPLHFQTGARPQKVSCIVQDVGGRLWVGTRGGGLWVAEEGRFKRVSGLLEPPGWGVYAILPEPDGTMWLGTSEGLYRFAGGHFVHMVQKPDLVEEKVFSISEDERGTLWLTTYSGGLIRLREGVAKRITSTDGLGENTFYSALPDGKGTLWLTTNGGILAVSLRELDAFADGSGPPVHPSTLGIEDGLRTLECNGGSQPAGFLARNGKLWFPTARGAVSIDPSKMAGQRAPVRARIEALLVNGRPFPPGVATAQRGAGGLEFRFSVPSLLKPGNLDVRYKLEGFDSEWTSAGSRRTAYYTNVPPGRYTFRVKGMMGRGESSEAGLPFSLRPPLYRHPLFLAAIGLAMAGLLFALHRLRIGWLRRSRLLLEETVARRTAELTVERDRVKSLEEGYRAVVEDQTEMICRFAPDGTLVVANGAMGHLWGLAPEDLVGKNLYEFLPEAVRERTRGALSSLTPQSPCILEEQRVRGPDGSVRVHQWSIRAFFAADGTVTGFQGVGRDVTDLRHLAERLVQAQKMEAIGRLAGGVAHDFNNLLQAMFAASGTLRRTCAPCDKGMAVVGELDQDIQRAARLTRQLLLFAHQEAVRPQLLDLNTLVLGVESLLRRLLRENVSLSSSLHGEPLPILVDPGQMEQAVVNLVMNASDAMPSGGHILLAVGADGDGWVWLSVSDSGPGIPREMRERIFDPFFTTKGPEMGTGLGLPVVMGIVQQSGGTISVESSAGGGAEFRIRLPRAEGPIPASGGADGAPLAAPAVQGSGRILLVEDDPGVREWLCEALRMMGYEVTAMGKAREALEWANGHPFDLVLSDLLLPDASGAGLLRQVEGLRPGVALVLMSGYAKDAVLRKEMVAGTVRFLQKPFSLDTLEGELRMALSAARNSPAGASSNP